MHRFGGKVLAPATPAMNPMLSFLKRAYPKVRLPVAEAGWLSSQSTTDVLGDSRSRKPPMKTSDRASLLNLGPRSGWQEAEAFRDCDTPIATRSSGYTLVPPQALMVLRIVVGRMYSAARCNRQCHSVCSDACWTVRPVQPYELKPLSQSLAKVAITTVVYDS